MSRSISLIFVLIFTALFYSHTGIAKTASPYIYRINAAKCDHKPTNRQLTGFRMQGTSGIATALHGVIDCESISAANEVSVDLSFTDLRIKAVDLERDMALLSSNELDQLPTDDGFYAASNLDDIENEYFRIIGYPLGIRLQTSVENALLIGRKRLRDLLPLQHRQKLLLRDSPNPDKSILQIQAHLVPGHSGAPILNDDEEVVGVGNGGLEGGTVEIGWLIPITDIEWSSVLSVEDELNEVRKNDPSLTFSFSSTYPKPETSSSEIPAPTSTPTRRPPIYVNPLDNATYLRIPAGEFIMGSSDQQIDFAYEICIADYGQCQRSWFEDEQPQRVIYLDDYWIMQTEVTNAQYNKFMDADGYTVRQYWGSEGWQWRAENDRTAPANYEDKRFNAPNQPVIGISWYEAEAYTNWLSAETGLGFNLPTEEEWEKAARGIDDRIYPWGNDWGDNRANYCDKQCREDWADANIDDKYIFSAPVGSYSDRSSIYEIFDLVGNVWEWTANRYNNTEDRVIRGGSWYMPSYSARLTERMGFGPNNNSIDVGFRVKLWSPDSGQPTSQPVPNTPPRNLPISVTPIPLPENSALLPDIQGADWVRHKPLSIVSFSPIAESKPVAPLISQADVVQQISLIPPEYVGQDEPLPTPTAMPQDNLPQEGAYGLSVTTQTPPAENSFPLIQGADSVQNQLLGIPVSVPLSQVEKRPQGPLISGADVVIEVRVNEE